MAYERREVVSHTPGTVHEHSEVVETPPAAVAHDQVQAVTYDPYLGRRSATRKLISAIYLIFGIVMALIAIRFVLKLLGANPQAGFAQFIYGVTDVFIAPFIGLFGTPAAGGSVLELHSLVALVVYALLAWLIAKIIWLLVGETRSAVKTSSTSVDTHVR